MFHLMTVHSANTAECSFETDRMRFIGRPGSVAAPQAMTDRGPLSDTEGSVLDPITAIRNRTIVEAGATVSIDIVSGAGDTREAVVHLVDKDHDRRLADACSSLHGPTVRSCCISSISARRGDGTLLVADFTGRSTDRALRHAPRIRL